jgi:hypothetical protein
MNGFLDIDHLSGFPLVLFLSSAEWKVTTILLVTTLHPSEAGVFDFVGHYTTPNRSRCL